MKRVVVNVSSKGREDYITGTRRLVQSLKDTQYKGDVILFNPEFDDSIITLNEDITLYTYKGWGYNKKYGNCLPHNEASHQFKAFTLQFARESGYDQVIWMDSPIVVTKDPQPYFDILSEVGVLVFDAKDSNEAEWTADIALERMGCSIEFARQINQRYSGLMMFDFNIDVANTIFDYFIFYSYDKDICNGTFGSTRPEFKEHRHDQSIISYCIRKYGLYNLNFGGYIWDGFLGKWGYNNPTFINTGITKNLGGY